MSSPRRPRLRFIGGIGDQLQLAQHELRDHQGAVDKSGFDDIGDAAVDDDAGVENLESVFRNLLAAEEAAQRRQVQHVAFGPADDQAAIGRQRKNRQLEERKRLIPGERLSEHAGDQVRDHNSQHAADRRADQALQTHLLDADLENDDQRRHQRANRSRERSLQIEGTQKERRAAQRGYEKNPDEE